MDIKEIKAVLDLCKKQDVAEFELKTKDFEIKLKRGAILERASRSKKLSTFRRQRQSLRRRPLFRLRQPPPQRLRKVL